MPMKGHLRLAVLAGLVVVAVASIGAGLGSARADKQGGAPADALTSNVILFASDGMRPDLVEQVRGRRARCRRTPS